jgi:CBS domain-containing protein
MNIGNILATKGSKVITIHPEQSLKEAIALLTQNRIGALVVVDAAGKPVGILSERDIIHAADHNSSTLFTQTVKDNMTTHVIHATPHDDLHAVSKTMTDKRFRHMPVMDGGKLVGIVSIGDVVKAQMNDYRGTIDNLQSQL